MSMLLPLSAQYAEHHLGKYIALFSSRNKEANKNILADAKEVKTNLLARTDAIRVKVIEWTVAHSVVSRLTLQALSIGCRAIQIASVMKYVSRNALVWGMIVPKFLEVGIELLQEVVPKKIEGSVEKLRRVVRSVNRTLSAAFVTCAALRALKMPQAARKGQTTDQLILFMWDLYKAGGVANLVNFLVGLGGALETVWSLVEGVLGTVFSSLDVDNHPFDFFKDKSKLDNPSLKDKIHYWIVSHQKDQLLKEVESALVQKEGVDDTHFVEILKDRLEQMQVFAKKLNTVRIVGHEFIDHEPGAFNKARFNIIQELWKRRPKENDEQVKVLVNFITSKTPAVMRYNYIFGNFRPLFDEIDATINRLEQERIAKRRAERELRPV